MATTRQEDADSLKLYNDGKAKVETMLDSPYTGDEGGETLRQVHGGCSDGN